MAKFNDDFIWGAATASHQVEGRGDGIKGESIWDVYSRGNTIFSQNADRTCDQYNNYKEDIKLMKELGLKSYRFSIAWTRVFPFSMDEENPSGFDYYHRLIDELLANNIEPNVTIYHWDLPQYLQDLGGWNSRKTIDAYLKFAESCFRSLGDKVKMWATFNEPACISYGGYYGLHGSLAPGINDKQQAYNAVHHVNLAHGLAVRKFRDMKITGEIGIVCNVFFPRPATQTKEDQYAADRGADKVYRMFIDPIFNGTYPKRHLEAQQVTLPIQDGDMEIIKEPIDWFGFNYYWEDAVRYDASEPEEYVMARTAKETTAMGWDIVPEGLYRLLKHLQRDCRNIPLYIAENGCAYDDVLTHDQTECHDPLRKEYLLSHFSQMIRAINEGVPLKGYYAWSLIDNFEWTFGYTKRFGLVYCDYSDLRRIPKDSFYTFREVIAGYYDL